MRKLTSLAAIAVVVAAACSSAGSADSTTGDTPDTSAQAGESVAPTSAPPPSTAGSEAPASAPQIAPADFPADEVAIQVDDQSMTWAQLGEHLADWFVAGGSQAGELSPPAGERYPPEFVAGVVAQWIQFETFIRTVDGLGVEVTDDHRAIGANEVAQRLAALPTDGSAYERLVAVQAALSAVEPTADDIAAFYDANVGTLAPVMCTSHILHDTEADAQITLDRYNEGEDFAALAIERSTGPSGPSGGDLGCVPEGSFVPEFETAVQASAGGDEVLGPVETQFGFHIIQVHSIGTPELEQARDQILEALRGETDAAFRANIAAALVTLAPELGTWNSTTGQVVPAGG